VTVGMRLNSPRQQSHLIFMPTSTARPLSNTWLEKRLLTVSCSGLFWTLRSELHDPMLMERFGSLLEEFLKGLRPLEFERIGRESQMLGTLIAMAYRVKGGYQMCVHAFDAGRCLPALVGLSSVTDDCCSVCVTAFDRRKTEDAAAKQTVYLLEELSRIMSGSVATTATGKKKKAAGGGTSRDDGAGPIDQLPATFTLPLDPSFESCGAIDWRSQHLVAVCVPTDFISQSVAMTD
jgi:hypothetical protein